VPCVSAAAVKRYTRCTVARSASGLAQLSQGCSVIVDDVTAGVPVNFLTVTFPIVTFPIVTFPIVTFPIVNDPEFGVNRCR
jgi:hypothetical protein